MNHTPGPWSATPSDLSEGYECYWITAVPFPNGERELATVSGPQNRNNEANANLIAAAPDLLAELENAVIAMQCQCDGAYTRRNRHEPNSFCYLLPDFEAVIKKAKGETE